jgi:hypothetical protein
MSQADLAAAMAERGLPWSRTTVINLEKRGEKSRGKTGAGRDSITVQELLTLAFVLGVSPALLLADPRSVATVPIAKDETGREIELEAWTALFWLIGVARPDEHVQGGTYRFAIDVIHDGLALVERINFLMPQLGDGFALPELAAPREQMVRMSLESVAALLKSIEGQGAPLPTIPSRVRRAAAELDISLPGQEA